MNSKFFISLVVFLLVFSSVAQASPAGTDSDFPSVNATPTTEPIRITLFIPSPTKIHSDQIMDQVNTPEGGVLFGTSFGLSLFNGTWSTRHINRDNLSQGLMDEFITAVEYDHDGNLWIGYSGGIQIYNGMYYQTLRDQQLFKDTRIQDLQRWHDDMWVATGNSGIHRYRDGIWTWFQPMSKNGPDFYEIRGMTLDPASDTLMIATADNGLWMIRSPGDPVAFEQIATKDGSYASQLQVRRDPLGGVYFFNDTTVIHYTPDTGFTPVLYARDLTRADSAINDLAAAPDGRIFLATDDGIYIWKDQQVYRHISRYEGIGTSSIVRTITIDSHNRVWFSTDGYVGYYVEQNDSQNPIQIQVNTPVTTGVPQIPATQAPETTITTMKTAGGTQSETGSGQESLAPILNPIFRAINTILSRLGMTPGSG